jgi:hypothetical protein
MNLVSAVPPKADIHPRDQDVRFGPIAEVLGRNEPVLDESA